MCLIELVNTGRQMVKSVEWFELANCEWWKK